MRAALEQARNFGLTVTGVVITADEIRLECTSGAPDATTNAANPWDAVVAKLEGGMQ